MQVGLLSDTHGTLPPEIFTYLETCDEIWHAGDIGSIIVTDNLSSLKPLRAVFGNIDNESIRKQFPAVQYFLCEQLKVLMTHITGTPPKYNNHTQQLIKKYKPDILVGGHTHILRIERDKTGLLYINPGAVGNHGIHPIRTLLRFCVLDKKIFDMKVIEIGNRRY